MLLSSFKSGFWGQGLVETAVMLGSRTIYHVVPQYNFFFTLQVSVVEKKLQFSVLSTVGVGNKFGADTKNFSVDL